MSIKFINYNDLDIYLKKELLDYSIFDNKELLEKYLRNIINRLINVYKVKIEGFYNVTIYIDKYYGAIIHMQREDLDYYDYFKGELEMKIILKRVEFLYLVDNILDCHKNCSIINKNGNIYIKLNSKPSKLEFMNLLEHSKIIYDVI